ncbi:hypothetical protein GCM10011495_14860 [Hymenobacter frigidus]|uniref:Phosphoribosylpyrophosphate synthetase n=2 Tax=Hymenobacter frigidus TaxID=1524095 RepID=A0ABQ2A1P2_9BACT|nr:hypothetical protein GCM10011495_14860 [Hymenobacter frigidus]
MDTMTTLSEITTKLKNEGYIEDFNLKESCLECPANVMQIFPHEFVVDKHYRFEGASDPADAAVVYAISSPKYHLKGILVNGYGMYSDTLTDDMVKALKEKPE